jgi:hypothetical protein
LVSNSVRVPLVVCAAHGAAYLGRLASLLGRHDVADEYLRAALDTAVAFGWEYHRATTMIELARSRVRRIGAVDTDARRS